MMRRGKYLVVLALAAAQAGAARPRLAGLAALDAGVRATPPIGRVEALPAEVTGVARAAQVIPVAEAVPVAAAPGVDNVVVDVIAPQGTAALLEADTGFSWQGSARAQELTAVAPQGAVALLRSGDGIAGLGRVSVDQSPAVAAVRVLGPVEARMPAAWLVRPAVMLSGLGLGMFDELKPLAAGRPDRLATPVDILWRAPLGRLRRQANAAEEAGDRDRFEALSAEFWRQYRIAVARRAAFGRPVEE